MTLRLPALAFVVCQAGCLFVDVPADAVFFCDAATACPTGTACNLDAGRCLRDDLERQAPRVAVTASALRVRPGTPLTLSVTSDEPVLRVRAVAVDSAGENVDVDGPAIAVSGAAGPFVLPLDTGAFAPGAVIVTVTAVDLAGNNGSAVVNLTLDAAGPTIGAVAFAFPEGQTEANGRDVVRFTVDSDAVAVAGDVVDDGGDVVGVVGDVGVAGGVVSGAIVFAAPVGGALTLRLTGLDDLGNESVATTTFFADDDAPDVDVDVADAAVPVAVVSVDDDTTDVVGGCVAARAAALDVGCGVSDCAIVTPLQPSVPLAGLPVGEAVACAVVVDNAGNRSVARTTFTVLDPSVDLSVDVVAVEAALGQQPGFVRPGQAVIVTGACGDAEDVDIAENGVDVGDDTGDVPCVNGAFAVERVAVDGGDGRFVVSVTARGADDVARSASVSVVVDGEPPVLRVTDSNEVSPRTVTRTTLTLTTNANLVRVRARPPGTCNGEAVVDDSVIDVAFTDDIDDDGVLDDVIVAADVLFAPRGSLGVRFVAPSNGDTSRCAVVEAFDNAGNVVVQTGAAFRLLNAMDTPTVTFTPLSPGGPGLGRNTLFTLSAGARAARRVTVAASGMSCVATDDPQTFRFDFDPNTFGVVGTFALQADASDPSVRSFARAGSNCSADTVTLTTTFVDDQERVTMHTLPPLPARLARPSATARSVRATADPNVFLLSVDPPASGRVFIQTNDATTISCEPAEAFCSLGTPPPGPVVVPTQLRVSPPNPTLSQGLPFAFVYEDDFGNTTVVPELIVYIPPTRALPLTARIRETIPRPLQNTPPSLDDGESVFVVDVDQLPPSSFVDLRTNGGATSSNTVLVNDLRAGRFTLAGAAPRTENIEVVARTQGGPPTVIGVFALPAVSVTSLTPFVDGTGRAVVEADVALGAGESITSALLTFDELPGQAVVPRVIDDDTLAFDIDLDDDLVAAGDLEGPLLGNMALGGRLVARVELTVERVIDLDNASGTPQAVTVATMTTSTATRLYLDRTPPFIFSGGLSLADNGDDSFTLSGFGMVLELAGGFDVTAQAPALGFIEHDGDAVTVPTPLPLAPINIRFTTPPDESTFVAVDAAGNTSRFPLSSLPVNP